MNYDIYKYELVGIYIIYIYIYIYACIYAYITCMSKYFLHPRKLSSESFGEAVIYSIA